MLNHPHPLHVVDRGCGDRALVFLHYFAGSSRAWAPVMDRLADYRCIALDLRGFGDSDGPATGYAVNDSADDVAALIASLGLARYGLIGHSMGGKIALALAARRPPGLEALLLIAPSPPTPEPILDDVRAHLLASRGDRASAEDTARAIMMAGPGTPAFAQVVEDNLRTAPPAWRAWLEQGSREDISALMPRIDRPVLVLVGDEDTTIPPPVIEREVVARIEGAHLVRVARSRHLVPLDAPQAVADAVRRSAI